MQAPYYVIEILYPDGSDDLLEISEPMRVIGRSRSAAHIRVEDKKVSGKHAKIEHTEGQIRVQDIGSTNGTIFHGQRIEDPFDMHPGESFRVGNTTIRLLAIHEATTDEDAPTLVSLPAWVDDGSVESADVEGDRTPLPPASQSIDSKIEGLTNAATRQVSRAILAAELSEVNAPPLGPKASPQMEWGLPIASEPASTPDQSRRRVRAVLIRVVNRAKALLATVQSFFRSRL